MRRFVLVVGVFGVLVAGCTGSPAPPPKTSTTSAAPVATTAPHKVDPKHIKAKDAFGDFTTVAPCTMLDLTNLPGTFRKHGSPGVVWSQDIDECTVMVPVASDGALEVDWGELVDEQTARFDHVRQVEDLGRGMQLLHLVDEPRPCAQYLMFADDVRMSLDVFSDDGNQSGLCSISKTVAGAMVKTLVAKPAGHRLVRDVSLLHQDACRLLSPDIPATLPGDGGVALTRTTLPRHDCAYSAPGGRSVALYFGSMDSGPEPDPGGKTIKVAGRPTAQDLLHPANGSGCMLRTAGIPLASDGSSANQDYEGAVLTVLVSGRSATVCADAVKLAAKVWPKLPKA